MTIIVRFIYGFKLGLEYCDLDDDDRENMGLDSSLLIMLDLGVVRLSFFTGTVSAE